MLNVRLQPPDPTESIVNGASEARRCINPKKIVVGEQQQATRFHVGCNPVGDSLQRWFIIWRNRVVEHVGNNDEIESPTHRVKTPNVTLSKSEISMILRWGSRAPHGSCSDINSGDGL